MVNGWKGWLGALGTIVYSEKDDCHQAAWVTPLQEGDPVPGERWSYRSSGSLVEVLTPPVDGVVLIGWLEGSDKGPCAVYVNNLRPIPRRWRIKGYPMILEATDKNDLREQLGALADDAEVVE